VRATWLKLETNQRIITKYKYLQMPPPMNQSEARVKLSNIITRDKATLVSPKEGTLKSNTPILYLCGECHIEKKKTFNNLINGTGGALCLSCAQTRGNTRRLASLNATQKQTINAGKTDFNRTLAVETAAKNGSTLLGICCKEGCDSYSIITDDHRITRDSYLHILCPCGNKDYINFRIAYGVTSVKPGEGLCLCAKCRKGHRSNALRETLKSKAIGKSVIGEDSTTNTIIESICKRASRIERDGQECISCKLHKPSSEFFGKFNNVESCKVYTSTCYTCNRKRRTSNREDTLRNGSLEDFMRGELLVAKDRTTKHNKKCPDKLRDFNITVEFLMDLFELQGGKCAISRLPMITTKHRDECPDNERCNPNKLSIDRIDSNRGYTEDNIQLVRWRVNSMKMNMTCETYKEEIRAQYESLLGKKDDYAI
jgi:hypothetical protein